MENKNSCSNDECKKLEEGIKKIFADMHEYNDKLAKKSFHNCGICHLCDKIHFADDPMIYKFDKKFADQKLQEAIDNEDYDTAAIIRDELKK